MKTLLYVGGPLILFIGFGLYSDALTFGDDAPGMVHFGGVEPGGTFALKHQETYRCDENGNNCVLVDEKTELSEIDGLELEEESIEYRDGLSSDYNKIKQSGIPKYTNITMKRPIGFDWRRWKFVFERQAAIEEVEQEYDEKLKELQAEEAE